MKYIYIFTYTLHVSEIIAYCFQQDKHHFSGDMEFAKKNKPSSLRFGSFQVPPGIVSLGPQLSSVGGG